MNFTQLRIALYTLVQKRNSQIYENLAADFITACDYHELVLCDFLEIWSVLVLGKWVDLAICNSSCRVLS